MNYLTLNHTASPEEYQRTVLNLLKELIQPSSEILPLAQAHLRFAAETVLAPSNIPAFANSQMDGYALTATAAHRENRTFTVGSDIPAGVSNALEINDDLVYPIMTGAPLPEGYDCVVPEEKAKPLGAQEGTFAAPGTKVELPATPAGTFVRYPGEDIRAGEPLVEAGTQLTAATLGALAAQGIGSISTRAGLHILVLTGGDEVTAAGADLAPGKIYDANGPMLAAQLSEFAVHLTRHHLNDCAEELVDFLTDYLSKNKVDLILSSGGISHGKYEVIKNAVELLSQGNTAVKVQESWFGHVTQQPGGPQGITLLETEPGDTIPLISFPGNPVSTLITYTLVLRPALTELYTGQKLPAYHGRLISAEMKAPAGKTQFRRAYVTPDGTSFTIEADAATGSHLLHKAAQANALVELEPETTYSAGDTLRWYLLNTL